MRKTNARPATSQGVQKAFERGGEQAVNASGSSLFTLERTCDAVANGELRDLGLAMAPTVRVLRSIVRRHIAPAAKGETLRDGA